MTERNPAPSALAPERCQVQLDGVERLGTDPLGARRHDLTHTVRGEREEGGVRKRRHALAPSTREVGHQRVLSEVKLRLVQDPPTAAAAIAATKRRPQVPDQARTGKCVARRLSRATRASPVHDFGDERDYQQVIVDPTAHKT